MQCRGGKKPLKTESFVVREQGSFRNLRLWKTIVWKIFPWIMRLVWHARAPTAIETCVIIVVDGEGFIGHEKVCMRRVVHFRWLI